jgi:hypothetical protein
MRKVAIILLLLLVSVSVYGLYRWYAGHVGHITVFTPENTEVILEGDFIYLKTSGGFQCNVPLPYGRYTVQVPEYNVDCMIHKNDRGNATIQVTGLNEFTVDCDRNAWVVKD